MLKIAVCIHLLQLLILLFDLFLCLLTIAIFFYAFVVTQWFCLVCIKHISCTGLGISLFDSKHLYSYIFTHCISLDMFYILLIVFICGFMEHK